MRALMALVGVTIAFAYVVWFAVGLVALIAITVGV